MAMPSGCSTLATRSSRTGSCDSDGADVGAVVDPVDGGPVVGSGGAEVAGAVVAAGADVVGGSVVPFEQPATRTAASNEAGISRRGR